MRGLSKNAEAQLRVQLEAWTSKMGREVIAPNVPTGLGFAFIAFDFGEGGNIAYCSSGERQTVVRAMRELANRIEPETVDVPDEELERIYEAACDQPANAKGIRAVLAAMKGNQ